ncbi:MAG TPA: LD-carboxypeptidase [Puia sp.]|nr:LD-carboxypeptidase [Puia sp.]
MITLPPFLQPGDLIAIVCPAGFMAAEKAQTCIDTLREWGYQVRIGNTLGGTSENYFSGADEQRIADLQQVLDDPSVKAILCGRGGYGLSRIIDRLDLTGFQRTPKWVIGFSDITVLHAHIFTNYHIATLHAPMAGAFNDGGALTEGVLSLRRALAGEPAAYTCPAHPLDRHGKATGQLVGGNLSLLAHMIGTPSDTGTDGKILFLEDVGEYLYNIDRMLRQLKRSGKLARLAGLLVGGFTELKDTTRPFGATVETIIGDVLGEYDYPVCFGFPVSHGKDNVALKIGVDHTLLVGDGPTLLVEA